MAEGFHDELNDYLFDLERDRPCQMCLALGSPRNENKQPETGCEVIASVVAQRPLRLGDRYRRRMQSFKTDKQGTFVEVMYADTVQSLKT